MELWGRLRLGLMAWEIIGGSVFSWQGYDSDRILCYLRFKQCVLSSMPVYVSSVVLPLSLIHDTGRRWLMTAS